MGRTWWIENILDIRFRTTNLDVDKLDVVETSFSAATAAGYNWTRQHDCWLFFPEEIGTTYDDSAGTTIGKTRLENGGNKDTIGKTRLGNKIHFSEEHFPDFAVLRTAQGKIGFFSNFCLRSTTKGPSESQYINLTLVPAVFHGERAGAARALERPPHPCLSAARANAIM